MGVVSRLLMPHPEHETDGNTLCSLKHTSISGTCHVKTVQVIHEKIVKISLIILFKGSMKFILTI